MARTKPLEEDEPLKFARGVLDQIIAKHDPQSVRHWRFTSLTITSVERTKRYDVRQRWRLMLQSLFGA